MSDDEVENLYATIPKKFKEEERHYDNEEKLKIKIPFQMCITGTTGSGKTNALIQLIKKMNCFEHIMLWAKDTEEPIYASFIDMMRQAEKKSGESILTVSNILTDLPSVDTLNKEKNNLLILDDMITEKDKDLKSRVEPYYIRGRKKNCSVVFLAQDYFKIPITVRKNSSYFIFTKVDSERDLTTILKDHGLGVTDEQIEQMYLTATKDGFPNFFMIDKKSGPGNPYRFRKNYKPIPIPGKEEKEGKPGELSKPSLRVPGSRSKGQKGRASGPQTSKPELTNDQDPKKKRPLTKDTRFEKAAAAKKDADEKVKEKGEERDALTADVNRLLANENPAFRRVALAYFQAQVAQGHSNYYDAFLELKRELPQLRREFEVDTRNDSRSAQIGRQAMKPEPEDSEDEDEEMYDEARMGEGLRKRRRVSRKKPTRKRKIGSIVGKGSKLSLDASIRRLASMI